MKSMEDPFESIMPMLNNWVLINSNPFPMTADHISRRIANVIASSPNGQLMELMSQMKTLVHAHPDQARNLLMANPQLSYALFQAMLVSNIVDQNALQRILHLAQGPSPGQPGPSPQPMPGAPGPGLGLTPPPFGGMPGPYPGAPPVPIARPPPPGPVGGGYPGMMRPPYPAAPAPPPAMPPSEFVFLFSALKLILLSGWFTRATKATAHASDGLDPRANQFIASRATAEYSAAQGAVDESTAQVIETCQGLRIKALFIGRVIGKT
jgi:hypothetical protein